MVGWTSGEEKIEISPLPFFDRLNEFQFLNLQDITSCFLFANKIWDDFF